MTEDRLALPDLNEVLREQWAANEMMLGLAHGWRAHCECGAVAYLTEVHGMLAGREALALGWSVLDGVARCPRCTRESAKMELI